jgi:hypothetical protein
LEVVGTDLPTDEVAVFAKEKALTASHLVDHREPAQPKCTIRLRATQSGRLSDLLSVGSRITRAEAYDLNGHTMDVGLRFNQSGIQQPRAWADISPNPVGQIATIRYQLPESGAAYRLVVFDACGRRLLEMPLAVAEGRQDFQTTGLPGGVCVYSVLNGDVPVAQGKIVVLK